MNTSGTEYYNLVKTCLKPYSTIHKHTQHTTMINMSFSLYFHGNIHHCPNFWLCALYGSISSPWHWVSCQLSLLLILLFLGTLGVTYTRYMGGALALGGQKLRKLQQPTDSWNLQQKRSREECLGRGGECWGKLCYCLVKVWNLVSTARQEMEACPHTVWGTFYSCMGTMPMLFTSHVHLVWTQQDTIKHQMRGGGVVSCRVPHHGQPNDPLRARIMPQYFTCIFKSSM